jgi:DHA1 family tetracycline resistance protein-like MFS transporter
MRDQRFAFTFIFITVLIDMIGIGIIIPVLPALLMDVTGTTVLADVVKPGIMLIASYAIMQFLFAPAVGELSDRFGRRPVLLASMFGFGIDYLIMAFAPDLFWLFVGRVLAGLFGSSHSVASAYIADISTYENKAKNFGMIGAAFGLGFIIGPAIGGIFGDISPRTPFFIAAGLSGLNLLMGFFVLPESLPSAKRRSLEPAKMIPGRSLVEITRFKGLGALILAYFLAYLAGQTMPTVWSYFSIEQLSWSEKQIGLSLMAVGILASLVQGVLIGPTVKKFGRGKTVLFGFVFSAIGMTLYAFATETWMMYAFMIPYVLGNISGPTIQTVLSDSVNEKEQGKLQGSLTGLMSLTAILGPLVFGGAFDFFIGDSSPFYFPGAPFALGGLIYFAGLTTVYVALRRMKLI